MPFDASNNYSRTKSFANAGTLLPADLNSIQDDLGNKVEEAFQKHADPGISGSLPTSPVDGQIAFIQPDTNVTWMFRYNANSADAYKWEFVGGPPKYKTGGSGAGGTMSVTGSNADNNTNWPKAPEHTTVPVEGRYIIAWGHALEIQNDADNRSMYSRVSHTDPTWGYTNTMWHLNGDDDTQPPAFSRMAVNQIDYIDVTANSTIVMEFCWKQVAAGAGQTANRYVALTPVRVKPT